MKITLLRSALLTSVLFSSMTQAQQPSSAFARGNGMQTWQHPDHKALVAKCKTPPAAFGIPINPNADANPPAPALPTVPGIAGIVAANAAWKVVWAWQGNNADGPIAGDNTGAELNSGAYTPPIWRYWVYDPSNNVCRNKYRS